MNIKDMKGWIYVIGSMEHLNLVKIGYSNNRPDISRLPDLQVGNPFLLQIWGCFNTGPHHKVHHVESYIHKNLKDKHFRGEWYKGNPQEVSKLVEGLIKKYAPATCK